MKIFMSSAADIAGNKFGELMPLLNNFNADAITMQLFLQSTWRLKFAFHSEIRRAIIRIGNVMPFTEQISRVRDLVLRFQSNFLVLQIVCFRRNPQFTADIVIDTDAGLAGNNARARIQLVKLFADLRIQLIAVADVFNAEHQTHIFILHVDIEVRIPIMRLAGVFQFDFRRHFGL